ncbi:MAG TPA: hypothetical protein VKA38_02865 [Draconibacterium sp.]|nr:hypothetical protein [Draconibacterium sp.]
MQQNQILLKNTIIRKLENAHAIWFEASKSFLLFEEPAFTVFQMVSNAIKTEEIIKTCKKKYGHIEENIAQFVHEIIEQIEHFNNAESYDPITVNLTDNLTTSNQSFPLQSSYRIGNAVISVHYQNENLKSAIHPVIKHLEIQEEGKIKHMLEIVENEEILYFKYNGKNSEAFKSEDITYFSGAVKQQMYSIVFKRGFNDWMMILHASGVVSNNESVLFSAASGSGKSSVSAILKANGFGYISDDFIAADENGDVYPFPAAISIKEGAVKRLSEFYPELMGKDTETAFTGKTVRYLPVFNYAEMAAAPFPVKALVFVQYNNSDSFHFEKVSKKEALQLLLKETWVNPVSDKVTRFFDWIEKTDFYRLQYSKWEQALNAIQRIYSR